MTQYNAERFSLLLGSIDRDLATGVVFSACSMNSISVTRSLETAVLANSLRKDMAKKEKLGVKYLIVEDSNKVMTELYNDLTAAVAPQTAAVAQIEPLFDLAESDKSEPEK